MSEVSKLVSCQLVIVDIFSLTPVACSKLLKSLYQLFALTCSGSVSKQRIPEFALHLVAEETEVVFPFQSIQHRQAYEKLSRILDSIAKRINEKSFSISSSILGDAVLYAASSYSHYRISNELKDLQPLQITLFTCSRRGHVWPDVHRACKVVKGSMIKVVQVLYLSPDGATSQPNSVDENCGSEMSELDDDATDQACPIEEKWIDPDVDSIFDVCKLWLLDLSTDSERVHITLPPTDRGDLVTLKCDQLDYIMDTSSTSWSSRYNISRFESNKSAPQRRTSTTAPPLTSLPVYHLKAVKRISLSNIPYRCIFGTPVVLRATRCWKIDWDELSSNEQDVFALAHMLKSKEMALLLKLSNTSSPGLPCGYYFLLSDREPAQYLTLVSALCKELVLEQLPTDSVSPEVSVDKLNWMDEHLSKLHEVDGYDPSLQSSSLFKYLSTSIQTKSRGRKKSAPSTANIENDSHHISDDTETDGFGDHVDLFQKRKKVKLTEPLLIRRKSATGKLALYNNGATRMDGQTT